ncbi:hypothetical protein BKA61DRAFT_575161 [Leptodontidium sp. MPI-SDFR-AT-0119]|nr:hypothetical protein BKA61DRAFT_575161 [Leptodontidium sp. MPI-SDFR-AT-0119]
MSVQLPSNEKILAFCRTHYRLGARTVVYPSQNAPIAFIKIASSQSAVESEISNHRFAFDALEALPKQERAGIRVPKIYRVLEEASTRYIIMEYVQGQTLNELLDQDILHDLHFNQISKAIKLFLSFEVPVNATPGPIGGGIIRHPLFKDAIASIESLRGNFIFTNKGDLYIVDFEHAGFLPASFMTYALDQPRPVCIAIKNDFAFLPYENLEAMRVAGHNFMIRWRKADSTSRSLAA